LLSGRDGGAAAGSCLGGATAAGSGFGADLGSADLDGGFTSAAACGSQGKSRAAGLADAPLPSPAGFGFAFGAGADSVLGTGAGSGAFADSALGAGAGALTASGFRAGLGSAGFGALSLVFSATAFFGGALSSRFFVSCARSSSVLARGGPASCFGF
jgi:hypothetical protein